MWSIRMMECDLAIKRNSVLTHATWGNLKNTTLGETGQTRKTTHCTIPFMCGAQDRQTDRAWTGGEGEGEGQEWAYLLWGDEHVLALEVAAALPCGWTKCHWTDDLNKGISKSPPRAPVAAVPSTSCAPEGSFSTPFRSLSSPTGSRQGLLLCCFPATLAMSPGTPIAPPNGRVWVPISDITPSCCQRRPSGPQKMPTPQGAACAPSWAGKPHAPARELRRTFPSSSLCSKAREVRPSTPAQTGEGAQGMVGATWPGGKGRCTKGRCFGPDLVTPLDCVRTASPAPLSPDGLWNSGEREGV